MLHLQASLKLADNENRDQLKHRAPLQQSLEALEELVYLFLPSWAGSVAIVSALMHLQKSILRIPRHVILQHLAHSTAYCWVPFENN